MSATASLAQQLSDECREEVKSEAFKLIYPDAQIKPSTDSKAKWYTTAGGGVYATGAEGQITGFGAGKTESEEDFELFEQLSDMQKVEGFNGAIIYDDPLKPEDANSDIKREKINNRYVSTIKNRLNSRRTPIIIIMQRIHVRDLIGYVNEIEPGEWHNFVLPELTQDEHGNWQAMDETKRTVKELLAMRNHHDAEVRYIFETQHQQNPFTREGLEFPVDSLKFVDFNTIDFSKADMRTMFADPADTGGDDFATIKLTTLNGLHYVDVIGYNTTGAEFNSQRIIEALAADRFTYAEIESNAAWRILVSNVRKGLQALGVDSSIVRGVVSQSHKHERILANSGYIRNRFVFRADWADLPEYAKFMRNLTTYMTEQTTKRNAHDDAPDVCAAAAKYLNRVLG